MKPMLNISILFIVINTAKTYSNKALLTTKNIIYRILRFVLSDQQKKFLVRVSNLYFLNKCPRKQARRYLDAKYTINQLFSELKKREVNYVVLRWFEELPSVGEGEDIDILIEDEDLLKISDLFTYDNINQVSQAFDIYSITGVGGTDYNNMPYYPPYLATKILESRVWLNELYPVPNTYIHFLSLAYHAVFHKGMDSGIPHEKYLSEFEPEHDYLGILKSLALSGGIHGDFNKFSDFYFFLKKEAWIPEIDTLRLISLQHPWLYEFLPESKLSMEKGELMVFVIRDWVVQNNKLSLILKYISKKLKVLMVHELSRQEREMAAIFIRGGKWEQEDPYPVSGGKPTHFIICYDRDPVPSCGLDRKNFPFVNNSHVFIKKEIRDLINSRIVYFKHANFIHSADDELEAMSYIRRVVPCFENEIASKISQACTSK